MKLKELKSELYFDWIDDLKFKTEITQKVKYCKSIRFESQKEVSKWTKIPLTKIKQIENGSCKDFNAINNYINYLS
jgi:hypothetical protein